MENFDKYEKPVAAFRRLLQIMDELREKCPWDREQTFDSLRNLTVEETFELSDAIFNKDTENVAKELGDLLLHIVFYSKIASETGEFNIADVINQLCDKLILRHPHVYDNETSQTAEQVHEKWEKIKLKKEGNRSVLGGIPDALPALIKAYRIQDKASGVGFDWNSKVDVWNKVQEEIAELKDEELNNSSKIEDEFGDVLFSLVNYARFLNIHPEDALEKTNRKFIKRFQKLEELMAIDNKKIFEMSLPEMDVYWDKAKEILNNSTQNPDESSQ